MTSSAGTTFLVLFGVLAAAFAQSDPCTPNPCNNGGTCTVSSSGAATCACTTRWQGATCSEMSCGTPNPCKHGGVCHTTGMNHGCDCVAPWTGRDCEYSNQFCANNPCQNGGTCYITQSGVGSTVFWYDLTPASGRGLALHAGDTLHAGYELRATNRSTQRGVDLWSLLPRAVFVYSCSATPSNTATTGQLTIDVYGSGAGVGGVGNGGGGAWQSQGPFPVTSMGWIPASNDSNSDLAHDDGVRAWQGYVVVPRGLCPNNGPLYINHANGASLVQFGTDIHSTAPGVGSGVQVRFHYEREGTAVSSPWSDVQTATAAALYSCSCATGFGGTNCQTPA